MTTLPRFASVITFCSVAPGGHILHSFALFRTDDLKAAIVHARFYGGCVVDGVNIVAMCECEVER